MNVHDYLQQVADIKPTHVAPFEDADPNEKRPDCYYSKFDGSYITMVGMEDNIAHLAEREITDDLTHGVGFSPKDGKWYGWSHRAIYGFEIGSTCEKGSCHYQAANEQDVIAQALEFWSGENHINVTAEKKAEGLIHVGWTYADETPNEKIRGERSGADWHYNPEFGRGEWEAKTMEDAKQMAIDFNEGVS
jgi:hypothetical protein